MKYIKRFMVEPGTKVRLDKIDAGFTDTHVSREAALPEIEKHRHNAEIQVKSRTAFLSGRHETDDLYASINEVADKLERQALKHKEKLQQHKQRRTPRQPTVAAAIEANAAPDEQRPHAELRDLYLQRRRQISIGSSDADCKMSSSSCSPNSSA